MTRFLRPARLLPVGDEVWLVDESWPVAGVVDPAGAASVASWPASESASYSDPDRVVVTDGLGLVVQDGRQVAWVGRTGTTIQDVDAGLRLSAADPETAWLVDRTYVEPGDPVPAGRIVALGRDGSRTTVPTPSPVNAVAVEGPDVVVTLAAAPVARASRSGGWRYEYPTSRVRVGRHELLATGLTHGSPVADDARGSEEAVGWSWLETDPEIVRRRGVAAGGLLWSAGAPFGGDRIDRKVVAVGHDPTTTAEVLRVDLGPGLIRSVRAVGDELWVALARRRFLPYAPRDGGVDVLTVAVSGEVRVVHHADSLDVTSSAPPLRRPTDHEVEEHIARVRGMFGQLEEFWHSSADGAWHPLTEGLSGPSVTVAGEWPHTRVVVTLRHTSRPGVLLRRTLTLFDDAGRPIDREHADINLMEDLDTGYLAPAEEAVDGVLDT